MLRERMRASNLIAAGFRDAEDAADRAASLTAECMATMLRERATANLPLSIGLDALRLVADATTELVKARERMIEAHGALLAARCDIGLRAYGDTSECPPAERTRGTDAGAVTLMAVA